MSEMSSCQLGLRLLAALQKPTECSLVIRGLRQRLDCHWQHIYNRGGRLPQGTCVAVLDIANAFLHSENDEEILMLLRGKLAEMMVQVDPMMYRKYVPYSAKGQAMLYVKLIKALYGMLRATLLFYKRLRSDLEDMGFEVNPYDPCVTNKTVNGKQMTIRWHVDDLKVSHLDKNAVTALALKLAKMYGPKTKIARGKVHEYLGMQIDWGSPPGTMIVSMIKYLQKVIEAFPEVLDGKRSSPASVHLFNVCYEANRQIPPE